MRRISDVYVVDRGPQGYWAIFDQGICFLDPSTAPLTIEFFSFAPGRTTPIAAVEGQPQWITPGLAVAPDGQWLLYMQHDHKNYEIMLVENWQSES